MNVTCVLCDEDMGEEWRLYGHLRSLHPDLFEDMQETTVEVLT